MPTHGRLHRGHTWFALLVLAAMALTLVTTLGVPVASAQDRNPVILTHAAEQSTALSPGEAVTFTATVGTDGGPDQTDVVVRIDYNEVFFTSVEVQDGQASDAVVDDGDLLTWEVGDLDARTTLSITYRAVAAGAFPAGANTVENEAIVFVGEERIASAVAGLPVAAVASAAEQRPVTELNAGDIKLLLSVLVGAAFLIVLAVTIIGGIKLIRSDADFNDWRQSTSVILDLLAVVVIVAAVLILAVRGSIGEDGAISILSGIAGYVLGRAVRTSVA